MICYDWNHVWRVWASAGCVAATKALKMYLCCLLCIQMMDLDTLPRHKQCRNVTEVLCAIRQRWRMLTTLYRPMHQRSNKICPENPFTKANQSWKRRKFMKFYINIDLNVSICWRSSGNEDHQLDTAVKDKKPQDYSSSFIKHKFPL